VFPDETNSLNEEEVRSECLMADHEKCMMQSVPNAEKNAKFLSSPTQTDLYIAESVMRNADPREEIDTKRT
jgi:hypothetical protein